MSTLPVNEVFPTIQGEAYWTGSPSTFIRLQGCDVGCPWCDTKHTWARNRARLIPIADMLVKTEDTDTYANVSVEELVAICRNGCDHVVVTGGEPCDHDLTALTDALMRDGRTVQIETSGTADVRVARGTWVTVSPKIGMPGGKAVLEPALRIANEIKMPVGKRADVDRLLALLDTFPLAPGQLIWLQPLSQNLKATALCLEAARQHHCRVSIQTHKFLGVR